MNYSEEIIDSYLKGELSGPDLQAFENSIASDPKLAQEVTFQKDIVQSIQSFRHQQLKSRLNSIEISTGNGFISSVYLKFAASIVVVASLIGGTVFWINSAQTEANKPFEETQNHFSNTAVSTAQEKTTSVAAQASGTNTSAETIQQTSVQSVAIKSTSSKTLGSAAKNQVKQGGNSNALTDESIPAIDHTDEMDANFEMPDASIGAGNISSQNIKVNIVKENTLGYRFFNNQLFLHGNFSNSTYELYELNASPKKQVFLYFENNYYELTQGKTKVTPLVVIKDKSTIDQLNILRSR